MRGTLVLVAAHTNLARLPGSNAPVERVFSQMNDICKDSRNRFTIHSIKAMLIAKASINLPCEMGQRQTHPEESTEKEGTGLTEPVEITEQRGSIDNMWSIIW